MVTLLAITPDRKERLDYTYFAWTEAYTFIVPKPELESRLFAFMQPFQLTVNPSFSINSLLNEILTKMSTTGVDLFGISNYCFDTYNELFFVDIHSQ